MDGARAELPDRMHIDLARHRIALWTKIGHIRKEPAPCTGLSKPAILAAPPHPLIDTPKWVLLA